MCLLGIALSGVLAWINVFLVDKPQERVKATLDSAGAFAISVVLATDPNALGHSYTFPLLGLLFLCLLAGRFIDVISQRTAFNAAFPVILFCLSVCSIFSQKIISTAIKHGLPTCHLMFGTGLLPVMVLLAALIKLCVAISPPSSATNERKGRTFIQLLGWSIVIAISVVISYSDVARNQKIFDSPTEALIATLWAGFVAGGTRYTSRSGGRAMQAVFALILVGACGWLIEFQLSPPTRTGEFMWPLAIATAEMAFFVAFWWLTQGLLGRALRAPAAV